MTDSEAFEELLSAQDIAELFGSDDKVPDDIKKLFEPASPQESAANPPAQNHTASFPLLSSEEDLISALFDDVPLAPKKTTEVSEVSEIPEGITSLFGPEDDFHFSPFKTESSTPAQATVPPTPPPSEPVPSEPPPPTPT